MSETKPNGNHGASSTPQADCQTATLQVAPPYQPAWGSVKIHTPAPEWLVDAKFGIYFHWGAYTTPQFGSEWYARNMYRKGSDDYNHHVATYGDPYTNWPYHKFIDGGYDKSGDWVQFAPKLKSEGGHFDPDEWAQLILESGARFAGPSSEHHDGYSMWDSQCNEWNSVSKGPHLNLAGLFADSIRKKGLKFLIAMHQEYNYLGYYQHVPLQTDPSLKKLYGQLDLDAGHQLWYGKMREIVDKFQPDMIWQDGGYMMSEDKRLAYLSYYYNKAIEWGKDVVTTYKSTDDPGEVYDYEQGGPPFNPTYFWLTDQNIGPPSWSYVDGMPYYSAKSLINGLVDKVSKNGMLLLDISPMADGTIPQEQKDILYAFGAFLNQYGEAIYATRPWEIFGEGPTEMTGFPVEGSQADIRFTRNKARTVLFAIALSWPDNGQMVITSLKQGSFDASTITGIKLVGGCSLSWSQEQTGLKVILPTVGITENGVAISIAFDGCIPGLEGGKVVPAGYTYAGEEGHSFTLPGICDVVYGANGVFGYKADVEGIISFDNATFGDPIPGVAKRGFFRVSGSIPGKRLFYDGFHGDVTGQGAPGWEPNGGSWRVIELDKDSKVYEKSDTGDSLSVSGADWTNYYVQGWISLLDENGGAGLLGRVKDSAHYYQLELSKDKTGTKKWWIWKNNAGEWDEVASGFFDFSANTSYLMRLKMIGSSLQAYVSADKGAIWSLLGGGTDLQFASGRIGVRAWGSAARFGVIDVASQ